MGRKNKRKKSSYARKMKTNPKKLLSRQISHVHNDRPQTEHSDLKPLRGDVWFAELGEHPGTSVQEGCRPAFIMSNDVGNTHSETVTVIPMTSKIKKEYLPTHVTMAASDCPNLEPSMVLAEQVTTIGKAALKNYVGKVTENKIQEIERAVGTHLGLAPRHESY